MATVSELSVAITAETEGLERVLDRFKRFGEDLQRVGTKMTASTPLADDESDKESE